MDSAGELGKSDKTMEHVIPQMVVTAADEDVEDLKDAELTEPQVSVCDITQDAVNGDDKGHIIEDVNSNQTIECRSEEYTDETTISLQSTSCDLGSQTTINRPLVIEKEKCISQPGTTTDASVAESKTPSPHQSHTTAMQRPLVFDGSSQQDVSTHQGISEENLETVSLEKENVEEDILDGSKCFSNEETKPKSSSFSWMPSLPKLHSSKKEGRHVDALDKEKGGEKDQDVNVAHSKKDGLHNVKKFFDNFLHDSSSGGKVKTNVQSSTEESEVDPIKHKNVKSKKIGSPEQELEDSVAAYQQESSSKEPPKESKYNLKKMLDSFKSEPAEKSNSNTPDTESDVLQTEAPKSAKSQKSGIKKVFNSFKPTTSKSEHAISKEMENDGHSSSDKANKYISLKQEDKALSHELSLETQMAKPLIESHIDTSSDVQVANEAETRDAKVKADNKHPAVKKFLTSFRTADPSTPADSFQRPHVTFSNGSGSLKRSLSFRESFLMKNTIAEEGDKAQKNRLKSMKKYFNSVTHREVSPSDQLDEKKKGKHIKRSQSCRETLAEKEHFHGLKNFFDSFAPKNLSKSSSSQAAVKGTDDHVYDFVGNPDVANSDLKCQGEVSKPSGSKQVTKQSGKQKDDHSGMRKIFDSFLSKESSSKNIPAGSERIYEKVDISSSIPCPKDTFIKHDVPKDTETSSQNRPSANDTKQEEKYFTSETPANYETEETCVSPVHIDEPSTSFPSMFSTIGDNLLAIKDKMLHPKESKKADMSLNDQKVFDEYDLQNAVVKTEICSSVGTYRVIDDNSYENTVPEIKPVITVTPDKKQMDHSTKVLPESSPISTDNKKTSKHPLKKSSAKVEPESPETLYDTCCMKLAGLLGKKALEIVSDRTKLPPKKPPKPSAEAIAKARAEVVSKRLKEIHHKGQGLGENIPVGYDGIRFVDDETESSCDYKDVDNFDYLVDYELINRYKFDKDNLTDPSTCSGISSYYTADAVTLKDEHFSDAPLESISLNNGDCNSFHHQELNGNEFYSLPTAAKSQNKKQTLKSASTKKIPPPLPPKPNIVPKPRNDQCDGPKIQTKESVSECINGLSLSPRTQNKFSKDKAATQKRPLLVAGLKGTEFTSLQTKHREGQIKTKERTFNTVLKNESLKKINAMSPLHTPLQSSKSSPIDTYSSLTKKQTPQRPPLPAQKAVFECAKVKIIAPPVPEKPKREIRTTSSVKEEKRTISPPRPPPPINVKVAPTPPPPRPPPPILKSTDRTHSFHNDIDISPIPHNLPESFEGDIKDNETKETSSCNLEESKAEQKVQRGRSEVSQVVATPQISYQEASQFSYELQSTSKDDLLLKNVPQVPPRGRRIRSRTVEIPPKKKEPESGLRRSQSLTDIDVEKRMSSLKVQASTAKTDVKHLYTSVNKSKKTVLNGSQSPSQMKRPLPAPPPPPRKFRSLDRKPKEKSEDLMDSSLMTATDFNLAESGSLSLRPPERKKKDQPRFHSLGTDRRNKDLEEPRMPRSYSVPTRPDRRPKQQSVTQCDENANFTFPTVAEVHSPVVLDECGNEVLSEPKAPELPPKGATDWTKKDFDMTPHTHPRQKKDKSQKVKSHSSWYDETQSKDEDWEMIEWDPSLQIHRDLKDFAGAHKRLPLRRRSDPLAGRRTQPMSKFYVNVDMEGPPLIDKETSPVHFDCSEKSIQTSLETLSQSLSRDFTVSREEPSEDAESSDTEKLLNMVKTLQTELKTTLNRHKTLEDESLSSNAATDSEKGQDHLKKDLKTPSAQSSTSELWPLSSSEESEEEVSSGGAMNLSEMALTRKKKKIFYIAQEIMSSEEVFVDTLRLLNMDFKAAVEAANKQKNVSVVPDEILSQILNHLPQLQHLNENLLMELKDRIDNWEKSEKIADIIVKMGPFLKLYSWYIHDFESSISLLEESKKKYPLFSQAVKEFETSARCKRLALNHYMLKPIQRIPQYRLLLQEYLHQLSEDSPDYHDTVTALQIVSEVANHANDSMKQGDNAQKLISIQNSILGHKEIIKPGRLFVKEGELMKLSRKGMQPRWFILFNDMLLYLTSVQQGLYRINHDLPLTGMKVAIPIQQDYQNEFSIISVTRSFTLAAKSQEERQEWIVALTKAIEENASKRSTFTNIRLQQQKMLNKNSEDDESEFELGKRAPVWIPDARVTMCQLCTSEFTVTFRRHHCRACGKVICSICSSNRIPLSYLGGGKVNRVCDECFSKLGPGTSGYAENPETDSDNQQIAVKPHLRTEHRYVKKGRRNLPSVLKEVCANDQGSTISGYLQKRSGKNWKKEWFVVKDKVLYEYKASEDVAALKSTPLLGYQIEPFTEVYENVDPSLLFQLTHPGQAPIVFHTDSVASTERWITALKEASVLE